MADRESEEASPIRATFLMSVTRGSLRVLGRSNHGKKAAVGSGKGNRELPKNR